MKDKIEIADYFLRDITDSNLKDVLERLTKMVEMMVKANRAGLQIPKKYVDKMNALLDQFEFHIEKPSRNKQDSEKKRSG
ncbi:MAG: hypothetical protein R6V46_18195 [Desulfatiglandaceae bacterium]